MKTEDVLLPISRLLGEFRLSFTLITKIYAVLRSGIFHAGHYVSENPDVPSGRIYSAWHFVKYCHRESRKTGHSIVLEWLLGHLLIGRVSSKSIRDLMNVLEHKKGRYCSRTSVSYTHLTLPTKA